MRYENLRRHASLFSEYTELRVQENTATSVLSINGDIVQNTQTKNSGVSARAFKDGVWGFASSPEQNDEAISASVKRATENARFLAKKAGTNQKELPAFTGQGSHGKFEPSKDADPKEVIATSNARHSCRKRRLPCDIGFNVSTKDPLSSVCNSNLRGKTFVHQSNF